MVDNLVSVIADESRKVEVRHIDRLSGLLAASMDALVEDFRSGQLVVFMAESRRADLVHALMNLWSDAAELMARILQPLIAEGFKQDGLDVVTRQILNQYIDDYGARRAAQIILTTENQIRDLVRGGLARGEAANTIYANVINRIPALAENRAAIISQTETHTTSQFVSQRLAESSGLPLRKVWNTVLDERTRDFTSGRFDHRNMNGARVDLTDSFLVPHLGGAPEALAYPGDPSGSAGNIINCRCVSTYERTDL